VIGDCKRARASRFLFSSLVAAPASATTSQTINASSTASDTSLKLSARASMGLSVSRSSFLCPQSVSIRAVSKVGSPIPPYYKHRCYDLSCSMRHPSMNFPFSSSFLAVPPSRRSLRTALSLLHLYSQNKAPWAAEDQHLSISKRRNGMRLSRRVWRRIRRN